MNHENPTTPAVEASALSPDLDRIGSRSVRLDLFAVSFLALFLELLLIRWVPSYERVLAYFTNFVLIAAFLGLGLGAMLARRRRDLLRYQPALLLLLVTVAVAFNSFVKTGAANEDVVYSEFGRRASIAVNLEVCLVLFFILIALVFVPLGQRIGRDLRAVKPSLRGYILNLVGSLLGVIVFSVLAFLQLAPVWWFALALAVVLWLAPGRGFAWWINGLIGVVTVIAVALVGMDFVWSPYHKISVSPLVLDQPTSQLLPTHRAVGWTNNLTLPPTVGFHIAVDDDFLQMALDLSPRSTEQHEFLCHYQHQYDLPYRIPNFSYEDVLIVGAGTGNDTAAALRAHAGHVDAVEIDPAIAALGRRAHPNQPYADPRVTVWVADARSYFNQTDRKYDMVVFGLLDSHRLFSSLSSVRLDSFMFTEESFRDVSRLLKPHGIVVVQHGLGAPFMGARMYRMLRDVFQMSPVVLHNPEFPGRTFAAGPGVTQFLTPAAPKAVGAVAVATDDWPFFYLAGRRLPVDYLKALVTMLGLTVLSVLLCSGGQLRSVQPHFLFLGSGFLLIETLSVTRFALLFGSTWIVNSIVFSAILLVILAANLWLQRHPAINTYLVYALLAAAILTNFFFPVHVLLRVGLVSRLLGAMALMAAPIFFAALIFAGSYQQTPNPNLAYASNLVGAVVGGLLEYSSLLIGFRKLLLIGLGLYVLSYIAWRWPARQGPAAI